MEGPRIFIRDDDVGELTASLRAFVRLFAARQIPVSYQIIPAKFTAECATFMLAARQADPALVEFGQHGLRHEMTVHGRRVFREFGQPRTYEEQLADIRAGKALLRERLGDDSAAAVFTPPQHRYDRNTLRALKAEGFETLSASSYPDAAHRAAYGLGRFFGLTNLGPGGVARHGQVRPDCGLVELSIAVAADDGSTLGPRPEAVVGAVARAARGRREVGLMLHHQAYKSAQDLAWLADLADGLGSLPGASFHRLGDLSAAVPGGR
ncbi:MAG: DUF2334 domain-containing protein [Caulobacteraceae bacterium]